MNSYQGIITFFRNIWVFRRTLCNHQWYDFSGILYAIRDAIADMEHHQRGSGIHANSELYCDKMRIIQHLLDRMVEDQYAERKFNWIDDEKALMGIRMEKKYDLPSRRGGLLQAERVKQQDLDYLCKLLNKHLFNFWD